MNTFVKTALFCIIILSLTSLNAVSAFHAEPDTSEHVHENHSFKKINQNKMSKIPKKIFEEIEIKLDYTVRDILRDGQTFKQLLLVDGCVECGDFGEERPFLQYSIKSPGEIDHISVDFNEPIQVQATPTPYVVPQILGNNQEILDERWEGELTGNVKADWTFNHLSSITLDEGFGKLYSIKLYPVEFTTESNARLFRKVKIIYSIPQNYMWYTNPDPGHKPTGPIKYLIITHPDLEVAVQPFAQWKSQKGLFTHVVNTNEIDNTYQDGDLQLKMRKYIQQMESKYDLDYLLLVGDWDKVPTRNTKNSYNQPMMGEPDTFASDLYFACVDQNTTWNKDDDSDFAEENEVDDSVPDMAIGRLAINSPSVLSSMLKNLIEREKDLTWDSNTEEAVYMCGDPGYMPGDPSEVMDYFWKTYGRSVFSGRKTIYHDGTGSMSFSPSSFKKIMNANHQAMCYFGHGQPNGFPKLYENNQINQLANNGTDGSLFAMACLTGFFDDPNQGRDMGAVDNCFAESLTETSGKGLVGYIGASRMAVGYIDTTYSGDAPGLEEDYWRAIKMAVEGNLTPTIGIIWREMITHFSSSFYPFQPQNWDNPALRTFLEYNLLGEPNAPLVFKKPKNLHLKFKLSQDKTSLWAQVTNATDVTIENAMVTIYRSGELGRAATTNATGEVTIIIPPNNGGLINITASRPGDIPMNYTFLLPDNLAPQPLYSLDPEKPNGNSSYYITQPEITLYGDEPVNIEYRLDEGTIIHKNTKVTIAIPNGNHTIHFRVVDRMGQWSEWTSVDILVDTTPPQLIITTNPESPDGYNGWFITKPTIFLSATETLNITYFRIDNGIETEFISPIQVDEGIHEILFRVYDLAGNQNMTTTTIKVDLTAPVSELTISHLEDGENSYYVSLPTIELTCQNERNAKLEYHWDSNQWIEYNAPIIPDEGIHTLYYRARDTVGNIELEQTRIFKVDTVVPNLEIIINPAVPDGENHFYKVTPIVEVTTTEGDIYYSLIEVNENFNWKDDSCYLLHNDLVIPEGEWRLNIMARDIAGNEIYLDPMEFKVDTTPPVFSWDIIPSSPDGEHGWYISSPSIKIPSISPDAILYWTLSNIDDWNVFENEVSLENGVHRLIFKAIDEAGNVNFEETDWIKVDLNAPKVAIENPKDRGTFGSSLLVEWTGEDDTSGLNRYEIKVDGKRWSNMEKETKLELTGLSHGTHTIYLGACDEAGNNFVVSRTFKIDASAPEIISRAPIGKNVLIHSKLIVTFSEKMLKESIKIEVEGLEGTITWDRNSVIFTPNQPLSFSTKYDVKITGSDQFNNSIVNYSWSFVTKEKPETRGNSSGSMFDALFIVVIFGIMVTIVVIIHVVISYRWKKKKRQSFRRL